jgi:hypothetical protein
MGGIISRLRQVRSLSFSLSLFLGTLVSKEIKTSNASHAGKHFVIQESHKEQPTGSPDAKNSVRRAGLN